MRLDRAALSMAQAYFFGTGYATELPSGWTAFLKSGPEQKLPDLQLIIRAGPPGGNVYLPPFKPAFADGFLTRAALLRPESTGRVRLASANPRDPIRIHFIRWPRKPIQRALQTGLRFIRELWPSGALSRRLCDKELAPDRTRRPTTLSAHSQQPGHSAPSVRTRRMGRDRHDLAIVDEDYACVGSTASVSLTHRSLPDLIGGNINRWPVIMTPRRQPTSFADASFPLRSSR
jgi:choline dehydrogenase-like flavoprotein